MWFVHAYETVLVSESGATRVTMNYHNLRMAHSFTDRMKRGQQKGEGREIKLICKIKCNQSAPNKLTGCHCDYFTLHKQQ